MKNQVKQQLVLSIGLLIIRYSKNFGVSFTKDGFLVLKTNINQIVKPDL